MITGAQFSALVDEAARTDTHPGAKVYLVFGPRDNGKVGVLNIIPIVAAA